ncbi:MAG: hypothetical protein JKY03_01025 [Aureispira sp.]|nr:hypothetical protein [Aureispira sp.]
MKLLFLVCFSLLLCTANLLAQRDLSKLLLEDYTQEDVQWHCWNNHSYSSDDETYPEDWDNQSAIFLRYEKNMKFDL